MSSVTDGGLNGATAHDQGCDSNCKYCANCGVKETKDIKLKICTACKSVHYCGVECQKKHRPKHKKDCRKRAAELRDELLFKQPDCCSHYGDCPICCLPVPHHPKLSTMTFCCSQIICIGCDYSHSLSEVKGERKCPFCRSPVPETSAQQLKYRMKRIKANCPVAIRDEGSVRYNDGKYEEAFDNYSKAAELGDIEAHYHLATLYRDGEGIEKDERKYRKLSETAAIGGHPGARIELFNLEIDNRNINRAIKHLVIAAKQGMQEAVDVLKECYSKTDGVVSKEVFSEALRDCQAALDSMKSPQRDAAEATAIQLGHES